MSYGSVWFGIGMLPSASLGDPSGPGVFEPCHGSAPDIGIALLPTNGIRQVDGNNAIYFLL